MCRGYQDGLGKKSGVGINDAATITGFEESGAGLDILDIRSKSLMTIWFPIPSGQQAGYGYRDDGTINDLFHYESRIAMTAIAVSQHQNSRSHGFPDQKTLNRE